MTVFHSVRAARSGFSGIVDCFSSLLLPVGASRSTACFRDVGTADDATEALRATAMIFVSEDARVLLLLQKNYCVSQSSTVT